MLNRNQFVQIDAGWLYGLVDGTVENLWLGIFHGSMAERFKALVC